MRMRIFDFLGSNANSTLSSSFCHIRCSQQKLYPLCDCETVVLEAIVFAKIDRFAMRRFEHVSFLHRNFT